MECTTRDDDHSVLNCNGFELLIHRIPGRYLEHSNQQETPVRRVNGPIRLNFSVDDIYTARSVAAAMGGRVDDTPPAWAPRDANFFLGHDPEGNVFKLSEHGQGRENNTETGG